MTSEPSVDGYLAGVFRDDTGRVLSALIAQLRDFDLAEEALQDALAAALVAWRRDGPPDNGAAWLLTVARRRAIDRLRRTAVPRKMYRLSSTNWSNRLPSRKRIK
jgi:RNA polymerase sigma-70 factor, ECF subfamily